jgi:NADH dehydrogenase FAD-containing subunit
VQHALVVGGGQTGAELAGELDRLVLRQPTDAAE